jgi:hypothetical protein
MKNYHELKEKELEKTKNYSDKSLGRYTKALKFIRGLYSELFFWIISLIPFAIFPLLIGPTLTIYSIYLVVHFFFWSLWGKKKYHEMCDKDVEELNLVIQVLEDIKKERNEK